MTSLVLRGSPAVRVATRVALAIATILMMFGVARTAEPQRQVDKPETRFVVVVNAENDITEIDRDQLSSIFLKRVVRWPNARVADPVDLGADTPLRSAFSESIHKRRVSSVVAFWQQQIFSGRDVPPAEKGSEAEVLSYVRDHVAAVGYVSASTELGSGVRVIEVHPAKH